MADLLTPKDVESEFGLSRSTLLSWEESGKISVQRTTGGHRRYERDQIRSAAIANQFENEIDDVDRLGYTEFGSTGLRRQGGTILEERLKELQGYSGRILRREMRMNDPVLGAMFFGISTAMRSPFSSMRVAPASDTPLDRATAEFVESALLDMSWDFKTQMTMIIDEFLEQGFSVNEVVFKRRLGKNPTPYIVDPAKSDYSDGKVGWRKWSPRPATSLAVGNEWIIDDNDGIHGINQADNSSGWSFGKTNHIPIPIEKLLHFRTTPHPSNSPEGQSIHRAAYVSWWRKTNLEELEGIGVERDLAGIPIVYLGKGTTKRGNNSDFDIAQDLVVNLRNDDQTGIVIPHPKMGNDGVGVLVELLSSQSRRQHNTNEIINRYNKLIAMTTLSQFLFLGMENIGSYALMRYQGDLFSMAISAYLDSILSVINRFAVPKLVDFNGMNVKNGYPELTTGRVGIPDLETFGKFVNEMVGSQVITIDDEFEQNVRQIAGLPPMSSEIQVNRDRTPQPTTSAFAVEETVAVKTDLQKD